MERLTNNSEYIVALDKEYETYGHCKLKGYSETYCREQDLKRQVKKYKLFERRLGIRIDDILDTLEQNEIIQDSFNNQIENNLKCVLKDNVYDIKAIYFGDRKEAMPLNPLISSESTIDLKEMLSLKRKMHKKTLAVTQTLEDIFIEEAEKEVNSSVRRIDMVNKKKEDQKKFLDIRDISVNLSELKGMKDAVRKIIYSNCDTTIFLVEKEVK